MDPVTLPLVGDRWTPFVHTIVYQGEDLTGANFAMQLRLTYDAAGAPLVDLIPVGTSTDEGIYPSYADTNTIAAHIAEGRLEEVPENMSETDELALTVFQIRINEATMEALPYPGERGSDAVLYYDIHVTPSGGIKQVWFRGTFTIRAGATV